MTVHDDNEYDAPAGQASLAVLIANELIETDPRIVSVEYTQISTAGLSFVVDEKVGEMFEGCLLVTTEYVDGDTDGRRRLTFNLHRDASSCHDLVSVFWNTWLIDLPDDVMYAELDEVPVGVTSLDGDELVAPPDPDDIAARIAGIMTTRG